MGPRDPNADDCYYFVTATCARGPACNFRHVPEARRRETPLCAAWLRATRAPGAPGCADAGCRRRHSDYPPDARSGVQCVFDARGGCTKPAGACPYRHANPASLSYVAPPAAPEKRASSEESVGEAVKAEYGNDVDATPMHADGDEPVPPAESRHDAPAHPLPPSAPSSVGGSVHSSALVSPRLEDASRLSESPAPSAGFNGRQTYGASVFGQSSFGSSSSNNGLGSPPAFGQSSFGTSSNTTGLSNAPNAGQSSFGSSSFGTAPALGQSSFGQSSFGAGSGSAPAFGQSSVLGAPSAFGSRFGEGAPPPQSFAQSAFGGGATGAFGQAASAFGTPFGFGALQPPAPAAHPADAASRNAGGAPPANHRMEDDAVAGEEQTSTVNAVVSPAQSTGPAAQERTERRTETSKVTHDTQKQASEKATAPEKERSPTATDGAKAQSGRQGRSRRRNSRGKDAPPQSEGGSGGEDTRKRRPGAETPAAEKTERAESPGRQTQAPAADFRIKTFEEVMREKRMRLQHGALSDAQAEDGQTQSAAVSQSLPASPRMAPAPAGMAGEDASMAQDESVSSDAHAHHLVTDAESTDSRPEPQADELSVPHVDMHASPMDTADSLVAAGTSSAPPEDAGDGYLDDAYLAREVAEADALIAALTGSSSA